MNDAGLSSFGAMHQVGNHNYGQLSTRVWENFSIDDVVVAESVEPTWVFCGIR